MRTGIRNRSEARKEAESRPGLQLDLTVFIVVFHGWYVQAMHIGWKLEPLRTWCTHCHAAHGWFRVGA